MASAVPATSLSFSSAHKHLKFVEFSAVSPATCRTGGRELSCQGTQRRYYESIGQRSLTLSTERGRKSSVRRLPASGGAPRGFSRREERGGPVLVHAFIDWAALPAWLVKTIATRVYPSKACGEGTYLDPRIDSCVFICQPGYAYDTTTKSCVLVRNVATPSALDNYVVRKPGEQFPDCGDGFFYDGEQDACVPASLAEAEPKRTWGQIAVTWLARRLFKLDDTSCPVGFYHDPVSKTCVPLCSPGFLYDPSLKKCIPASELLMQQQEAYKRRAK